MPLQININELEKALSQILEKLRRQEGEVVDVGSIDYYWSINGEEKYDPYQDPERFTLGQLTDDLEEIRKIASGEAEPVALDLVKVSAVLAAVGHRTVW